MPHPRATSSPPPPRHRVRGALKWLHLWLGLIVGTVFALVALSGTVLTFQREILLAQHPEWSRQPLPDTGTQARAFARLLAEWQPRGLRSADIPSRRLPVWQAYFPDGERRYFDPASGELLLIRNADNDPVLWLRELHTHLLYGETGEDLLGACGLIAVFLLLSGLYLWWPRKGALAASLRWHAGPPTRRWLSWHRSTGALLLPLLLLATVTGVAIVYHDAVRPALRWSFDDGPEPVPPLPLPRQPGTDIDWAAVLQAAQAAVQGGELRRISPPDEQDALVSIRYRAPGEWHPNGRSVVWLDPYAARAVQVHAATAQGLGARIDEAMYPLHGGFIGGWPWQWAVAASGLLPPFFLITGFLFWRARRRRTVTDP